MSIKGSLLILLTVSLGAALAMTSKGKEDTSGNLVDATTKEIRSNGVSHNIEQPVETHFDLSAIDRPIPKSAYTTGLFESKSWYVAPSVPPALVFVPPPTPTAPPLPFTFIGRMLDGNNVTVFLAKNDRQYTVKEKDVLDNTYRIDKIEEGEAILIYLPTNTQQTLVFNTTSATNELISIPDLKAAMRSNIPPLSSTPAN